MKIRYSEAFYSIQGEGRYVGVPSLFLRMFGCNFRCRKFGIDKDTEVGKYNPEVEEIIKNLDQYEKFEDLPIVHTGCDTYASIYPEFKKFMQDRTIDETVDHLLSLIPENQWTMSNGQDTHLILTGGEPLLWQQAFIELFSHPRMQDLKNVTIETNTTQALREDFMDFIKSKENLRVTFSCSPKLTVSGESWDRSIKPHIARMYYDTAPDDMYLKFVVADEDDLREVEQATQEYRNAGVTVPVYIMPLGGRSEEYEMNEQRVAKLAMEKGWRYSPRMHISLFGNAWGT